MKICLDASIAVKWFKKKDERFKEQAEELLDKISRFEIDSVGNELLVLEVIRAVTKHKKELKFTDQDIDSVYETLNGLILSGALSKVGVSYVLALTKDIIKDVNLPMADAVHLATAIHEGCNALITDDEDHLLKKKVRDHAKKFKVKILRLDQSTVEIPFLFLPSKIKTEKGKRRDEKS